jgi:hypothetical protein
LAFAWRSTTTPTRMPWTLSFSGRGSIYSYEIYVHGGRKKNNNNTIQILK